MGISTWHHFLFFLQMLTRLSRQGFSLAPLAMYSYGIIYLTCLRFNVIRITPLRIDFKIAPPAAFSPPSKKWCDGSPFPIGFFCLIQV